MSLSLSIPFRSDCEEEEAASSRIGALFCCCGKLTFGDDGRKEEKKLPPVVPLLGGDLGLEGVRRVEEPSLPWLRVTRVVF